MTQELTPVDGPTPAPDAALWVPISELARMRGVSKQAISKKVARYVEQGLLETRPGERGTILVGVAQFLTVDGQAGDAIRSLAQGVPAAPAVLAPTAPTGSPSGDPILAKEQARRTQIQADIAQLDLKRRLGELVPVEDVQAAMVRCGEALVRAIEQLPGRADDLSAAVAKDGQAGARTFLKSIAHDLRATLARELRLLEAESRSEVAGGGSTQEDE